MANLIELVGLGGAITLFTGQIMDSATQSKRDVLSKKEKWGTAILLGAGAIVSIQTKSPVPFIVLALVAGALFVIQERAHNTHNADPGRVIQGPWIANG